MVMVRVQALLEAEDLLPLELLEADWLEADLLEPVVALSLK